MDTKVKTCYVETDEFTKYIAKAFDYEFTGTSEFEIPTFPSKEELGDFNIGLIYGSSGSGKSTLLGDTETIEWTEGISIASHFETPEKAVDVLTSCGLNSIPTLCKPYHVLSNGEKFRADMARAIKPNAKIDEFTSVVNRDVAKSASLSISKYIRRNNINNVIFASCHEDIIEWLQPDWVYNLDTMELKTRRLLQRPRIELKIYRADARLWGMFKKHHYLSEDMNVASRCYVGVWNNKIIAFNASLSLPSRIPPLYEGDTRNKFRESRTVILPDFQGIGIGTRFSDAIGEIFLEDGYRYFSKTAHIRMGEYRQKSESWRPTSTNLVSRAKSAPRSKNEKWKHMKLDTKRVCYSHEYLGDEHNKHRKLYDAHKSK